MSGKFHRAARDGYLELLKEATKKDCNTPDEDGLTPTSWAAYEGNLDALRLIVLRGGDPNKCDHYGNTALHCAAARGHMSCVSYLVNFDTNVFALDNEYHTAKDLAAMNGRDDILRYLDTVYAKQEQSNPKQVKKLQDKSVKDAEKRKKEFDKIQQKADKKRLNEEKELIKERERIEKIDSAPQETNNRKKSIINTISRGSLAFINMGRKDSVQQLHANNTNYSSPKFSDLTTANNKRNVGGIQKMIQKKKATEEIKKSRSDFKVREIEGDGRSSIKKISGLRRDSEIMFMPNSSLSSTSSVVGKRGALDGMFNDGSDSSITRTTSEPDFMGPRKGSIFETGIGSLAFRSSMTSTLHSYLPGLSPTPQKLSSTGTSLPEDSLGSSDSVHKDHDSDPWEEEDLPSDDEGEATPVYLFLSAAGLTEFIPVFAREKIDLEALMLLTDEDLIGLKLPLGPRRKLMKAINERREALSDPGEVADSRL